MITDLFWQILGYGMSFPATFILVHNLIVKARQGDKYSLELKQLSVVYFVALLGMAVAMGIKGGN